jgi:hypothetical protein
VSVQKFVRMLFTYVNLHIFRAVLTSNDQLLDLTGSLVDLEDLSVSHQFLHGVVAVEAVAAEDLDSIRCILISSVTSEELENTI